MRLFKHTKNQATELTFSEIPWVPEDLARNLTVVTLFLRDVFRSEVCQIGLYGSWQRGDATPASDVDIVVLLNHEVSWFDAINGIESQTDARKDQVHWHSIEKKANKRILDSRVYSIAVVTQGMLDYYAICGPIHLQNWVHALNHCYVLWEN